jgi:hypothetical protein
MGKLDLFAILNDINLTKSFALQKDPDFQKAYDSFMVNRFLSMSPETVFEANYMNRYHSLPKNIQYLFLSDVIEKKKRFLQYIKADKDKESKDMIKWLSDIYKVNNQVAEDMLATVSDEEKELMKQIFTGKTIKKR